MTTYTDCLHTFREAAKREVPDEEISGYLEALEAHKRYLLARDRSMGEGDALRQAAKEVAGKIEAAAIIEKRNAALNYAKRMEHVGWVLNAFGKNPALGLESLLVGTQRAKDRARFGAAQVQGALEKRYLGGFITDLERTGSLAQFSSGAMDRDIARALWMLDKEDMAPVLAKLPKEARDLAKVIKKWQEVTRTDANKAGAWIGKRDDYIVRQSHDSEKIRRAGFDAWAVSAREHFDIAAMMKEHGVTSEKQMLRATYNNLASGNHLKDAPENVATAFRGPGNMAKKLSQSRTILFKDADAWFDYNQQFGTGNLRESVTGGLIASANSTGLMRTMGTNPAAMFDAVRDDVTLQLKADDRIDDVVAIDNKAGEYERYLSAVDGSMNRPGSQMWARRSANVRAWVTLSKLGGMVLSQLNDIAVYGSGARYQGRGFLTGMTEAVAGLGRDLSPPERRELAASLGVVLDNMAAEMGRVGSFSEPGGMNGAMRTFMKLNLSQWWTSRMRTSAAFGMSHHLALQAGKDFASIGPEYQRVLGLYGIAEPEWKAIRQASKRQVDGLDYITPDEVANLSDDVIRQYAGDASPSALSRERDALAEKVRVYFTDQTETLALEPDVKTRAILLQGTKPGTWTGELMRFLMQFKSFTGAYMQRVIGRELFGRGYEGSSVFGALRHGNGEFTGLASLIVTSTLMGYASMSLKDLAKGRTPRDPTESAADARNILLAAMVQGGGAGIYGDFLFGEASRFGSGFVETLAGPAISTGADLVDLYHKSIHGDDVAASAFNTAVSNTPFLNLFYTRAALNYMVLYGIQESMNPGYLRRMERRVEQEQAQTFLMPPSQVVP
jgi:hypothetical protein